MSTSTECAVTITSNAIGCLVASVFIGLFMWKLWFTENNLDKIVIFMQKNIVYLSYFFLLFTASSYALNILYISINCGNNHDLIASTRYDIIVILLILSLSTFQMLFQFLMLFQIFYGFQDLTHSLSKATFIVFVVLIIAEYLIEVYYDIDISFIHTDSTSNLYDDVFPAVFLGIDLLIAVSFIYLFSNKLSKSMKYDWSSFTQLQPADANEDTALEDHSKYFDTAYITKICVLCIQAIVMRLLYVIIVIVDELVYRPSDSTGFNVVYSIRTWITMVCISVQILCVYLLFPFASSWYDTLCKSCNQCCYIRQQKNTMEDYQQL
mmetsp:Transcript_46134/g.73935  ORF Transcript_46134/g.73935 Transcript_46134/m.73935 type:complete len:323 (+) Transcript_46134:42-1010(+)